MCLALLIKGLLFGSELQESNRTVPAAFADVLAKICPPSSSLVECIRHKAQVGKITLEK